MKDTSVIPPGDYCYTPIPWDFMGFGKFIYYPCPYWRKIKGKVEMESGYCDYLEMGDGEGHCTLLWDMVKECGINRGDREVDGNVR